MDIIVNVINQKMCITSTFDGIVSGSQNFVTFKFNLGEEWFGLVPFVQFTQNGVSYNQYLDNERRVKLPSEIEAGRCTMMLYGAAGDVRATTNYITLIIDKDILVRDASSTEITQTLYDQLVAMVRDIEGGGGYVPEGQHELVFVPQQRDDEFKYNEAFPTVNDLPYGVDTLCIQFYGKVMTKWVAGVGDRSLGQGLIQLFCKPGITIHFESESSFQIKNASGTRQYMSYQSSDDGLTWTKIRTSSDSITYSSAEIPEDTAKVVTTDISHTTSNYLTPIQRSWANEITYAEDIYAIRFDERVHRFEDRYAREQLENKVDESLVKTAPSANNKILTEADSVDSPPEVHIGDTEPTGDEVVWYNTDEEDEDEPIDIASVDYVNEKVAEALGSVEGALAELIGGEGA